MGEIKDLNTKTQGRVLNQAPWPFLCLFIISYNAGSLRRTFTQHIQISIAVTFGGLGTATVMLS